MTEAGENLPSEAEPIPDIVSSYEEGEGLRYVLPLIITTATIATGVNMYTQGFSGVAALFETVATLQALYIGKSLFKG
jgi:hypothetical protein